MKGMLLSKGFVAQFGAELQAAAKAAGITPEIIHLPDDPAQRLPADVIAKIEVAYLTRDAIHATLRSLRTVSAAGSRIVFDYPIARLRADLITQRTPDSNLNNMVSVAAAFMGDGTGEQIDDEGLS